VGTGTGTLSFGKKEQRIFFYNDTKATSVIDGDRRALPIILITTLSKDNSEAIETSQGDQKTPFFMSD
jgi:hypothetical protein